MLTIAVPDQRLLAGARAHGPMVQRYCAFFALLDWDQVPRREATRPWSGPLPVRQRPTSKPCWSNCASRSHISLRCAPSWLSIRCWCWSWTSARCWSRSKTVASMSSAPSRVIAARAIGNGRSTSPCSRRSCGRPSTPYRRRSQVKTIGVDVKHIYSWYGKTTVKTFVSKCFNSSGSS